MQIRGEHPITVNITQPDNRLKPLFLVEASDDPDKANTAVANLIQAETPPTPL